MTTAITNAINTAFGAAVASASGARILLTDPASPATDVGVNTTAAPGFQGTTGFTVTGGGLANNANTRVRYEESETVTTVGNRMVTVIDATTKRMVYMDRFNQIDYRLQVSRLKALAERYQPDAIIAEANSMGGPLVETLQWEDLPVQPFTTTNATKAAIIDGLALAFERGELTILNDATLINELQAYESERLPSGLIRYSAPEGMHDDCVMSLALAWAAVADSGPLLLWGDR